MPHRFTHNTRQADLGEDVGPVDRQVFELGKVLEVQRAVLVAVEGHWRVQADVHGLLLEAGKGAAHEAVVPTAGAIGRHEEEAAEAWAEQQAAANPHGCCESLRLVTL